MVLVFLTWGELYVLFPVVLADMFGARHAASNYSFLYITKGRTSVCAPKGQITSGGRTHSNNGWIDSIAGER